jgi:hypothetical protein
LHKNLHLDKYIDVGTKLADTLQLPVGVCESSALAGMCFILLK